MCCSRRLSWRRPLSGQPAIAARLAAPHDTPLSPCLEPQISASPNQPTPLPLFYPHTFSVPRSVLHAPPSSQLYTNNQRACAAGPAMPLGPVLALPLSTTRS